MHSSLLASTTVMVWKALEATGHDSRKIFLRAGLDPDRLHDSNARFNYGAVRKLWQLAMHETQDPCFGLTAARYWHPSNFHGLGYAWLASSTLKNAFQRTIRYFRVVTTDPEKLSLLEHGDVYEFRVDTGHVVHRGLDEEYDLFLTLLIDACRIAHGPNFRPRRVTVEHGPTVCVDRYKDFFGVQAEFNAPHYALFLDKALIDATVPTGNADLALASERVIHSYLSHLDRSDVLMRVMSKLIEALPSGDTSEESIARALNMSLRTLQRKLREEGATYKELLDGTRRDLATRYIENSSVSVSEITYLLGFSEPSNFSRAFRRWTGKSPSAYRASHAVQ
ncbi:MAG: hypothetical protein AMJ69_04945 [Gammaproteobacteria bacterium SG8_47]|nr:MAG: hypothetical protein AMJ69_04945 [Gammaproteobacteria bacterium SG8_47]